MVQFTEKKKNAYNYYFTDSCWHYYIAPHVLSDKLNWIIEMDSMSPFIISNKLLPRICCHISILDSFTLVSLNSRCYLSAMLMSLFLIKVNRFADVKKIQKNVLIYYICILRYCFTFAVPSLSCPFETCARLCKTYTKSDNIIIQSPRFFALLDLVTRH